MRHGLLPPWCVRLTGDSVTNTFVQKSVSFYIWMPVVFKSYINDKTWCETGRPVRLCGYCRRPTHSTACTLCVNSPGMTNNSYQSCQHLCVLLQKKTGSTEHCLHNRSSVNWDQMNTTCKLYIMDRVVVFQV